MKKNFTNNCAFTFVELVVAIAIISILSVLGFVSYSSHLEDSRDSQRKIELSGVASGLETHKNKRGGVPIPYGSFELRNGAIVVAKQGKLHKNLIINTVNVIPYDPYIKQPYVYSVSKNNLEYQLAATLENNGAYASYLIGNYKSVSKNVLPTLVLAVKSGPVNVTATANKTKFIFDNSIHNLPYTLFEPYDPSSDGTSLANLMSDSNVNWSQNGDYRSCDEVKGAGKFIGNGTYQINQGGTLVNKSCN